MRYTRPEGPPPLDWVGLNYYSRVVMDWRCQVGSPTHLSCGAVLRLMAGGGGYERLGSACFFFLFFFWINDLVLLSEVALLGSL